MSGMSTLTRTYSAISHHATRFSLTHMLGAHESKVLLFVGQQQNCPPPCIPNHPGSPARWWWSGGESLGRAASAAAAAPAGVAVRPVWCLLHPTHHTLAPLPRAQAPRTRLDAGTWGTMVREQGRAGARAAVWQQPAWPPRACRACCATAHALVGARCLCHPRARPCAPPIIANR